MQTEGRADGIMCGFGSFDGVPSCANKRLLGDVLRGEWRSDAVVQSGTRPQPSPTPPRS